MRRKNYTPGYSGNISARYREGMLITTSGSSNGYLDKKILFTQILMENPLKQGKTFKRKIFAYRYIQSKAGYKFYSTCPLSIFELLCIFWKGFDGTNYGRKCILFWRNSSG